MKGNKNVVLFLVKFFGAYLLLFLTYSVYLNATQQKENGFYCAPVTKQVAQQSKWLLNKSGFESEIEQSSEAFLIKLWVNERHVANIIEGCNSLSIIILFVAFIFAFSNGFAKTLAYIVFGSLAIYLVNLVRIVLITVAIYKYPQYQELLHNYIFPLIIYGFTFLLWVIWVHKFQRSK